MRQLTPIEAARCARACRWRLARADALWPDGSHAISLSVKRAWDRNPDLALWDAGDTGYWLELPLDPYFWFPRLFDELGRSIRNEPWGIQYSGKHMGKREGDYIAFVGLDAQEDDHPCLALCAAIEATEGRK